MATDDGAAGDGAERTMRPRSRLFAVRLWTEDVAGGSEYRGSVRDVAGGAFRGFRDWSDLVGFMIERMQEDEHVQAERATGETKWQLQQR
jgi:hypothetical protein